MSAAVFSNSIVEPFESSTISPVNIDDMMLSTSPILSSDSALSDYDSSSNSSSSSSSSSNFSSYEKPKLSEFEQMMIEKFVPTCNTQTLKDKITITHAKMCGHRGSMEDTGAIHVDVNNNIYSAAVFDGHGGQHVSDKLSTDFMSFLESNKVPFTDHEQMKTSIIAFDKVLEADPYVDDSGSTLCMAVVDLQKSVVHVYNVGDSRCLVISNNDIVFESTDHTPELESEKKRIDDAGGYVAYKRVNGTLALSRALGDFDFKTNKEKPATEQCVVPTPDCTSVNLSPNDLILVFSDGVYAGRPNGMTNAEIKNLVADSIYKKQNTHQQTLELLFKECLVRGSHDNISCMLIQPLIAELESKKVN
jgi:serine/threonine protein phosphatase PrpC